MVEATVTVLVRTSWCLHHSIECEECSHDKFPLPRSRLSRSSLAPKSLSLVKTVLAHQVDVCPTSRSFLFVTPVLTDDEDDIQMLTRRLGPCRHVLTHAVLELVGVVG